MDMKAWVHHTWRILEQRAAAEIDQGYTISQIRTVLLAAIESLTEELEHDGNLTLKGFGNLHVVKRSPRRVRNNLIDGIEHQIPARRGVRFQAAQRLITRMNVSSHLISDQLKDSQETKW